VVTYTSIILTSCKVESTRIIYVDIVLLILACGYYMKNMILAYLEEGTRLNQRWPKGRIY